MKVHKNFKKHHIHNAFYLNIIRDVLRETRYQLDMFFHYEKRCIRIYVGFFKHRGMIRIDYGDWKCTNTYPP